MLWLLYVAWLTDLVGLVPKARPEARLVSIAKPPPRVRQKERS